MCIRLSTLTTRLPFRPRLPLTTLRQRFKRLSAHAHRLPFRSSGDFFGDITQIKFLRDGSELVVSIEGWIFHPKHQILNLWMCINDSKTTALYHIPERASSSNFPEYNTAERSGFKAEWSISSDQNTDFDITFEADLTNGKQMSGTLGPLSLYAPQTKIINKPNAISHFDDETRYFCSARNNVQLEFPQTRQVTTSIVLNLCNSGSELLACLESIRAQSAQDFELLIVAPQKTPLNMDLLEKCSGAHLFSYMDSCSESFQELLKDAIRSSKGEYLLFLNSYLELHPHFLKLANQSITENPNAGAISALITDPNGLIINAGIRRATRDSIEFFGAGEPSNASHCNFVRTMPIASGDLLLTAKETFIEHGGFEHGLRSMFYKGVAYCRTLTRSNSKIVFDPALTARQISSVNESDPHASSAPLAQDYDRFEQLAPNFLSGVSEALGEGSVPELTPIARGRILYILSQHALNETASNTHHRRHCIEWLVDNGFFVTLLWLQPINLHWNSPIRQKLRHTEVVTAESPGAISSFLLDRNNFYNYTILSDTAALPGDKISNELVFEFLKKSHFVFESDDSNIAHETSQSLGGKVLISDRRTTSLRCQRNARSIISFGERSFNNHVGSQAKTYIIDDTSKASDKLSQIFLRLS